MPGEMLADIRRQPASLQGVLQRADEIRARGAVELAPSADGGIHVVASGDGWFAARAVESVARRGYSLPYRSWSSLEFLCYGAPRLGPQDRVLAVSMSGNVDRVAEGIGEARSNGARTVLLTNGGGGRIATLVDATYSLDLPEVAPFLCGTSSYTATLMTLWLLLEGAAGDRGGEKAWRVDPLALSDAVRVLPALIDEADVFTRSLAESATGNGLSGARFLSAGPNAATADYAAAKLVELTRIPVWSDDLEEFAHRQYWSMDTRNLVTFLSANDVVARQAAHTAEALQDLGVATAAIETPDCPVPAARHRFGLPTMPEWLSPLCSAIPVQLLGYYLAQATGLDPDTRRHLKDDPVRFSVSRRMTRRSLMGTGR